MIIWPHYAYCDSVIRPNNMQTLFNQYHLFPNCLNNNSTFQLTFRKLKSWELKRRPCQGIPFLGWGGWRVGFDPFMNCLSLRYAWVNSWNKQYQVLAVHALHERPASLRLVAIVSQQTCSCLALSRITLQGWQGWVMSHYKGGNIRWGGIICLLCITGPH